MQTPRRVEHQQTDRGYVPVYASGVVDQPWDSYSASDHEVWNILYERQSALLPGYACPEFLEGLERFGLGDGGIPRFDHLNVVLGEATGWQIVAVEGLLPDEVFFDHLAHRRFPVSWWIRKPDQLDYLSEPDLFHDLFGHVPLLLNPVFADYMQAYGKGGMKAFAIGPEALNGVYGGTKAFVLAFSQSLRHELEREGVRVQVVLPGATLTEFWNVADLPAHNLSPEKLMPVGEMVDAALAAKRRLPDDYPHRRFPAKENHGAGTTRQPARRDFVFLLSMAFARTCRRWQ